MQFPMIEQVASWYPSGISKSMALVEAAIVYTAYASTEIRPARMVRISKIHHSLHMMSVEGRQIFR